MANITDYIPGLVPSVHTGANAFAQQTYLPGGYSLMGNQQLTPQQKALYDSWFNAGGGMQNTPWQYPTAQGRPYAPQPQAPAAQSSGVPNVPGLLPTQQQQQPSQPLARGGGGASATSAMGRGGQQRQRIMQPGMPPPTAVQLPINIPGGPGPMEGQMGPPPTPAFPPPFRATNFMRSRQPRTPNWDATYRR